MTSESDSRRRRLAIVCHSAASPRQYWYFKELAELGFDVTVIGPLQWGAQQLSWEENRKTGSYRYVPAEFSFTDGRIQSPTAAGIVAGLCPDILYLQEEPGMPVTQEILQSCSARCLVVGLTWENVQDSYTQRHLERFDAFVAGNLEAKAKLTCRGFPPDRILIHPQAGINTDVFRMDLCPTRDLDIVFVGRLHPHKGMEILMEVMSELFDEGAGMKVGLFGDGPLRQSVQSFQRRFPEYVETSEGWVDYHSVPSYFARGRWMIYNSIRHDDWAEQTAGYSVLEAMACGCNIISTDIGAIPEYLAGADVRLINGSDRMENRRQLKMLIARIPNMPQSPNIANRQFILERFDNRVVGCAQKEWLLEMATRGRRRSSASRLENESAGTVMFHGVSGCLEDTVRCDR